MRILLALLPLLGCQATASNSRVEPPPPTHLSPGASTDPLRQLQRELGEADLLIDVLELCKRAMDAAHSEEQRAIVEVCTEERHRRRQATAGSPSPY